MRSLFLLLGGTAAAIATCAAPAFAVDAFTFDTSSTVFIPSGQDPGKGTLILKLTGDAATKNGSLVLRDGNVGGNPGTTVRLEMGEPNRSGSALTWNVNATVSGLPVNSLLPRYLEADYAGYKQRLDYTVTNRPPGSFSWNVTSAPQARKWDGEEALPFSLYVGPIPATNVRVLATSFVAKDSLDLVDGGFTICSGSDAECSGKSITLDANELHSLKIKPTKSLAAAPGEYHGTFTLVSSEAPKGETFAFTFYASSRLSKGFGTFLIAFGIFGSLYVNVFLQNRNERNAKLKPAAVLADQAKIVKVGFDELAATNSVAFVNVDDEFKDIADRLSDKKLEAAGFIGAMIPYLKVPSGANETPQAYKDYLDDIGKRLTALSLILRGCLEAVSIAKGNSNPKTADALKTALSSSDKLLSATMPLTKESLASALQVVLQTLRSDLAKASGMEDDSSGAARPRGFYVGYTSEQLAFETAASNFVGWCAFALLSFAVGWYLLIASNPAFGQARDLLMCLLWGFGVPAAGEKLAGLTAPSVAQGFGITLTKVA
ncbi:hypothetical protein B5K06_26185 [Rhizobium grahamii]|uniref:Uncharacterized protein n=2 Tax=Rhizobium grahamii TaxID=1120045 RepID=A0A370KHS0_9HYPH|nr:hypothetical protein B5K06_26185 [Rhizobium grahamii]